MKSFLLFCLLKLKQTKGKAFDIAERFVVSFLASSLQNEIFFVILSAEIGTNER